MLMPGLLDAFAEHRITTPAGSEHGQREHDSLLDPEEVPEEPAEEEEVAQTLSTPEGLITTPAGSEHGQREHDSLLGPEEVPEEPAEEEEVAQTLSTPEGLISPVCGHCLPATRHAPTLKPAM
jgi:hypothetical protein